MIPSNRKDFIVRSIDNLVGDEEGVENRQSCLFHTVICLILLMMPSYHNLSNLSLQLLVTTLRMSKTLSLLVLVLLPEAFCKLGGPSVYDDIAGNYAPTANATTSVITGKQIERRILKQIDLIGGSGTPPASALPLQVGTRCELVLTSPKEYFVPLTFFFAFFMHCYTSQECEGVGSWTLSENVIALCYVIIDPRDFSLTSNGCIVDCRTATLTLM